MTPDYTYLLKNGQRLEIYQDEDPNDPRERDNCATFYFKHNSYKLAKEIEIDDSDCENRDDELQEIKKEAEICAVLPVSLYDHGGITIRTGRASGRDCGTIGRAFVTKKQAEANGWDEAQALQCIEDEVKTYAQYLEGDVYGYQVKENITRTRQDTGETKEAREDTGDGCRGFYGLDSILDEFKDQEPQKIR